MTDSEFLQQPCHEKETFVAVYNIGLERLFCLCYSYVGLIFLQSKGAL